jgi:hypothetical protein
MPPLAIPFKLRAKLYKEKTSDYWAIGGVQPLWWAELTQRAPGLPAEYLQPIAMHAYTRGEAAQKAREAFAKRDIQVVIR